MPSLDPSGYIWVASLCGLTLLWMLFIAPKFVPMLSRRLHDAEGPPLTPIDHVTLRIASLLMFVVAIIMGIMLFEVIMRYVFARPTIWVEELSRWLGGVIFLVAGLYAMQQRTHPCHHCLRHRRSPRTADHGRHWHRVRLRFLLGSDLGILGKRDA